MNENIQNLFSKDSLLKNAVLECDWNFIDILLFPSTTGNGTATSSTNTHRNLHQIFDILSITPLNFFKTSSVLLLLCKNLYSYYRSPPTSTSMETSLNLNDLTVQFTQISNFIHSLNPINQVQYVEGLSKFASNMKKFYQFFIEIHSRFLLMPSADHPPPPSPSHIFIHPVPTLSDLFKSLHEDLMVTYQNCGDLAILSNEPHIRGLFTYFLELFNYWNDVYNNARDSNYSEENIHQSIENLPLLPSNISTTNLGMMGNDHSDTSRILSQYQNILHVSSPIPGTNTHMIVPIDIHQFLSDIDENISSLRIETTNKEVKIVNIDYFFNKYHQLGKIGLLQIAMSTTQRIDQLRRRHLLYGLLFQEGLTFILEGNEIIAPMHEKERKIIARGNILFQNTSTNMNIATPVPGSVPVPVIMPPPDLFYFCQMKNSTNIPITNIIGFVLKELHKLDNSIDSLFRLKSYASVMNKLFYRGKELSDLYAATAKSHEKLTSLITLMEQQYGGTFVSRTRNGNQCDVIRYFRVLKIRLIDQQASTEEDDEDTTTGSGSSNRNCHEFLFPVYYEIVYETSATRISHEEFEYKRLKYDLNDEKRRVLSDNGFTIIPIGVGTRG